MSLLVGTERPFLTAEWRHLVMLNYRVEPSLLESFVPAGTELDLWGGAHYLSLVAFLFLDTRVAGVAFPFHRNFEEVNLRFYVKRTVGAEVRRGVVFIREYVPRIAIAAVAKWCYNERYSAIAMSHRIDRQANGSDLVSTVRYDWGKRGRGFGVCCTVVGEPQEMAPGSEEEFIAEHYWGYTRQRNGSTLEYKVAHPRWNAWRVNDAETIGDPGGVYPEQFAAVLRRAPCSVFLSPGSEVSVFKGKELR